MASNAVEADEAAKQHHKIKLINHWLEALGRKWGIPTKHKIKSVILKWKWKIWTSGLRTQFCIVSSVEGSDATQIRRLQNWEGNWIRSISGRSFARSIVITGLISSLEMDTMTRELEGDHFRGWPHYVTGCGNAGNLSDYLITLAWISLLQERKAVANVGLPNNSAWVKKIPEWHGGLTALLRRRRDSLTILLKIIFALARAVSSQTERRFIAKL